MNLEQQLKKLEDIAKKLESDQLSLEDAISLFEEGITLSTSIRTALHEAKVRIESIVEGEGDSFSIEPLDLDLS